MKMFLAIVTIAFISCQENQSTQIKSKSGQLIDYLKKEYKVDPQVKRFDSGYVNKLIAKKQSLDPDSLINS